MKFFILILFSLSLQTFAIDEAKKNQFLANEVIAHGDLCLRINKSVEKKKCFTQLLSQFEQTLPHNVYISLSESISRGDYDMFKYLKENLNILLSTGNVENVLFKYL